MTYFKCARIPTREMFVSFFREMYDRDPSWVNPTSISIPYANEISRNHMRAYGISVNHNGVLRDWPIRISYAKDGRLDIESVQKDEKSYGEINLTCDEYLLDLVMDTAGSYDREGRYIYRKGDTFRMHSTSAHELIYVCNRGGMLVPMRNTTKNREAIVDFYLFFSFVSYVNERLRRLYADNLLVDYSTATFTTSVSSIFKKVETEQAAVKKKEKAATKQQAVVKKEEKTATSSRNVFSTKDIIDGSAISTLIEVLEGKN